MIDRETAAEYVNDAERPLLTRIAELEADLRDAQEQLAELEPMRPLMDALHLELARRGGDCIEYLPEVPGHSPGMLRLGRVVLSGMTAGPLLEALRDAALDFTDDKED